MCHGWVRIFGIFFQRQKREIVNDKGKYLCQTPRNVKGVLKSLVMKRDGGLSWSKKDNLSVI